MRILRLVSGIMLLVGWVACSSDDPILDEDKDKNPPKEEEEKRPTNIAEYNAVSEGLKDYYADFFLLGAAIEPSSLDKQEEVTLLKRHFSSLTAENVMKWSSLQPSEGNYRWANADRIVDFAQENGMKVRGHTLVWHSQVPDWVFKDGTSSASKELVLERMRTHIAEVMTRYKGKVYAWDVVNEVIDDGSSTYRSDSKWYNICGPDFIFEAFRAARAADPDAKLYYNDYAATQPAKRDKIYNLLKKLKEENLVDGVGLQGHWNIGAPVNSLIIDAITKYSSLGIDINITELDVSVYTSNSEAQVDYVLKAEEQAIAYSRLFRLFRTHKDKISNITFWGVADNHTWLDNHPVPGRKNYPFLFGVDYQPKPAYFDVIDF